MFPHIQKKFNKTKHLIKQEMILRQQHPEKLEIINQTVNEILGNGEYRNPKEYHKFFTRIYGPLFIKENFNEQIRSEIIEFEKYRIKIHHSLDVLPTFGKINFFKDVTDVYYSFFSTIFQGSYAKQINPKEFPQFLKDYIEDLEKETDVINSKTS